MVGVVTEAGTGAPLPGVYVALLDADGERAVYAALTDQEGKFALRGRSGATYRIRAERVGLATATTDPFEVTEGTGPHSIQLEERAVELEGITVESGARACKVDGAEAALVQRWWDEARKALQSSAFVRANDLDRYTFERFQRTWTANLKSATAERRQVSSGSSSGPFLSQDAETLSSFGFIQGFAGQRQFLAPDAAVLLSDAFLSDHCLRLGEADEEEEDAAGSILRLAVEPVRSRDVPDIEGVLAIDTLTSELRSFDFEYVNAPDDLPRSDAGGHLSFDYLPSGAWIVSEWWIRMPQVARREARIGQSLERRVSAYVDEGGRVTGLADGRGAIDYQRGSGTVLGSVYDSLSGRSLADATVTVMGSRISARTDRDGAFRLDSVPAGRRDVTFYHEELNRLGLPSPVVPVNVTDGGRDTAALATPGFSTLALTMCGDPSAPAVLTGTALDGEGGAPVEGAEVRATWRERIEVEREFRLSSTNTGVSRTSGASGGNASSVSVQVNETSGERTMQATGTTGSGGHFLFCGLPAGVRLALSVRTDATGSWREAGEIRLEEGGVTGRTLEPGAEVRAVVRGYVSDEATGGTLANATISLLDADGGTVASTLPDGDGQYRLVAPGPGTFVVSATHAGYLDQSSDTLTLATGDAVELDFEMAQAEEFALEGLLVSVSANERMKTDLTGYGVRAEDLGRRLITTEDIDKRVAPDDFTEFIQWQGIPGVRANPNQPGCVTLSRAQTQRRAGTQSAGSGAPGATSNPFESGCAIILYNGSRISVDQATALPPNAIGAIAVLTPTEATLVLGTQGGSGAVLIVARGADTPTAAAVIEEFKAGVTENVTGLMDEWTRAWNGRRAPEVADVYAEDAVLILPRAAAVVGRDAVRARLVEVLPGLGRVRLSPIETDASGAMSMVFASFTLDGEDGRHAGNVVTVFEEARPGVWRIRTQVFREN